MQAGQIKDRRGGRRARFRSAGVPRTGCGSGRLCRSTGGTRSRTSTSCNCWRRSSAGEAARCLPMERRGGRGVGAGDRAPGPRRRRRDPAALRRIDAERDPGQSRCRSPTRPRAAEGDRACSRSASPIRGRCRSWPARGGPGPAGLRPVAGPADDETPDRAAPGHSGEVACPPSGRRGAAWSRGRRGAAGLAVLRRAADRRGVPRGDRAPGQHRAGERRAADGQDLAAGARPAAGPPGRGAGGADRLPEAERGAPRVGRSALPRAGGVDRGPARPGRAAATRSGMPAAART